MDSLVNYESDDGDSKIADKNRSRVNNKFFVKKYC